MSGEDETGQLIIGRNPKFAPRDGGSEILEYIKRSLNITDLSNKDKVVLVRRKKLRGFMEDVLATGVEILRFKHLVPNYGEVIGLEPSQVNQEFQDFLAAASFNRPPTW